MGGKTVRIQSSSQWKVSFREMLPLNAKDAAVSHHAHNTNGQSSARVKDPSHCVLTGPEGLCHGLIDHRNIVELRRQRLDIRVLFHQFRNLRTYLAYLLHVGG